MGMSRVYVILSQAKLISDFGNYARPLFESGELRPVIAKIFSWADVAIAHKFVEENQNTGKVVLRIE